MTDRRQDDDALEALFRQAAAEAPRPGAALMARVLADAEAQTRRRGGIRAAFAGLFGRAAFAGLATAALAGVWIGWAAPLPAPWGDETVAAVELIPDLEELVFAAAEWN